MTEMKPIHVVGGGLAGSEAAWQIARAGVPVVIHEMRPVRMTDAHKTEGLAELVCSNSFRSDDWQTNAVGLLHEEMRRAGSLIMAAGDRHKIPAGGALAVDRDGFSSEVTRRLKEDALVRIERGEITGLPPDDWDNVIFATGPLTSPALSQAVQQLTGEGELAFFDAIAPVIHRETVDLTVAWFQSRYDKPGPAGTGADYLNCPMTKSEYDAFIDALLSGEKTSFKEWEETTPHFEGCLPIEVMAERGRETLRYGPMKPVGLSNPHKGGERPYAVVQLRQDNALASLWNMVGFQTKLRHGEQVRVFRMIPGLQYAEFARLGGLHRNTFLNSPKLLDGSLRLKTMPRLRFAGQITGVEGYVESAAIGLLTGRFAAAERRGLTPTPPPKTTALGALLTHITGGHLLCADAADVHERLTSDSGPGEPPHPLPLPGGEREVCRDLGEARNQFADRPGEGAAGNPSEWEGTPRSATRPSRSFQPMNINYGLLPTAEVPDRDTSGKRIKGKEKGIAKKRAVSLRALADLEDWLASGRGAQTVAE